MSEVASPPSGAATPGHDGEPATVRVAAPARPTVIHRRGLAARRPLPARRPRRRRHRRRRRVLAVRGHRAAARRRRHRAASARPGGRRHRRRGRPHRHRAGGGDARARAAHRQLRAPRLRPPARRARPRRLRRARRRARRGRHRVGARAEPRRDGRRRADQAVRRRPRRRPARRGRRGSPPTRARAGLRPPAARPHQPRRQRPDVLRPAAPRPGARRRRPRPRRRPLRVAHVAVAALGRRRRPRRASARPTGSAVACAPRPRSGPGCPSSWTRWSPAHSVPSAVPGTCTPRPRCTGCSTRSWPRTTASRCSRPSPTACPRPRTTSGRTVRRAHTTPDPDRRRKLLVGLAGLAIAVLLVLGFVGAQGGFAVRRQPRRAGDRGRQRRAPRRRRARPPPPHRPHLPGERRSPSPGSRSTTPPATPTTQAASPASSTANSTRNWRTFEYRQQFPALKPGVGIMVSFASAVQLTAVAVDSPSPGTVIQVRSAQTADAALDDTTVITEGTLGDGGTPDLAGREPARHPRPAVDHQAGRGRLGQHHADQRGAVPPRRRLTHPAPIRGTGFPKRPRWADPRVLPSRRDPGGPRRPAGAHRRGTAGRPPHGRPAGVRPARPAQLRVPLGGGHADARPSRRRRRRRAGGPHRGAAPGAHLPRRGLGAHVALPHHRQHLHRPHPP